MSFDFPLLLPLLTLKINHPINKSYVHTIPNLIFSVKHLEIKVRDTKGAIRCHKSTKNIQCNCQKKEDEKKNNN